MLTRLPAALAALLVLSLASACGDEDDPDDANGDPGSTQTSDPTQKPTEPAGTEVAGTCAYPADGQEPVREVTPPPTKPAHDGKVSVVMKTSVGDLNFVLDAANKPCTVNSFLSLAEQDFYDDSPCPRLGSEPGFGILQCGDPSGSGSGGAGYGFADELTGKETYPAGTLAMANGGPDTNGTQFFLVFADSQFPPSYTVFGKFDASSIRILQGVAAKGHDGSHPAGGGKPNQAVDIEDVRIR